MNTPHVSSSLRRTPLPAWRRFAATGAAVLALATVAQAAVYYVDNVAGNDGRTTPGNINTPWKTVSKVSSTVFAAGDTINFKRGVTWLDSGTLTINDQGTSGAPITIQSYGTGAKPILDGNNLSNPRVRLVGANYIVFKDFIVRNSASACITVDGDSGNITILNVDASNSAGIAINVSAAHHITVDGCTVTAGGNGGIQFTGTLPFSTSVRDCTVQNCTVSNSVRNDGIVVHEGAPYDGTVKAGANFTFRNNTSTGHFEQGFDITSGSNILMENNVTSNNNQGGITIGHSANGVTVRYHKAQNEPTASTASTLHIGGANTTVEYSTFIGGSVNQPIVAVDPVSAVSQPENLVLRNNVFVWNSGTAGDYFKIGPNYLGTQITAQNLTIKNNIFASRTAAGAAMRFIPTNRPPNYAGYVIRNNFYDSAPATTWNVGGVNYASFAAYKAAYDAANAWAEKTGDPLFVSAGTAGDFPGDFRLQSGSTARDAGTSVIRTDTTPDEPAMLTLDFTRPTAVTIPQNGVRDIGAYEFPVAGTVPPAPSNLVASSPTSGSINLNWTDNSSNETGFEIDRATNSAFTTGPAPITNTYTAGVNATGITATGLSPSTLYYFRVRATNTVGDSTNSNTASATTSGGSPVVYDANALTIAASSGDGSAAVTYTGASNGNFLRYDSNAIGDFVTFNVNVPTANIPYAISVRYQENDYRGIVQLLIDGSNQGSAFDAHSETPQLTTAALGSKTFTTAGTHTFRFQITNKNAGSQAFQMGIDTITLTP